MAGHFRDPASLPSIPLLPTALTGRRTHLAGIPRATEAVARRSSPSSRHSTWQSAHSGSRWVWRPTRGCPDWYPLTREGLADSVLLCRPFLDECAFGIR